MSAELTGDQQTALDDIMGEMQQQAEQAEQPGQEGEEEEEWDEEAKEAAEEAQRREREEMAAELPRAPEVSVAEILQKQIEEEERKAAEEEERMRKEHEAAEAAERTWGRWRVAEEEERRRKEQEEEEDNKPLVAGSPASAPASAGGVEDNAPLLRRAEKVIITLKNQRLSGKDATFCATRGVLAGVVKDHYARLIMSKGRLGEWDKPERVILMKHDADGNVDYLPLDNNHRFDVNTSVVILLSNRALTAKVKQRQAAAEGDAVAPVPVQRASGKRRRDADAEEDGTAAPVPGQRASGKRRRGADAQEDAELARLDNTIHLVERRGFIQDAAEYIDVQAVKKFIEAQSPNIRLVKNPSNEQEDLYASMCALLQKYDMDSAASSTGTCPASAGSACSTGAPAAPVSAGWGQLDTGQRAEQCQDRHAGLPQRQRQGGDADHLDHGHHRRQPLGPCEGLAAQAHGVSWASAWREAGEDPERLDQHGRQAVQLHQGRPLQALRGS